VTPRAGVTVAASDGEREVGHMKQIEKAHGFGACESARTRTEAALETFPQSSGEG
jgi:hypothetical protein